MSIPHNVTNTSIMRAEPKNGHINESRRESISSSITFPRRSNRTYARESMEAFLSEYAAELDIFDTEEVFPDWVYRYRDKVLSGFSKEFRLICRILHEKGYKFKVKYPLKIGNDWKFADFYLSEWQMVILLIHDYETIGLPCFSKTDKELWFERKYRVLAVNDWRHLEEGIKETRKKRLKMEEMENPDFVVYTDGAYSWTHDEGAFAYVTLDGKGEVYKRKVWKITHETNQRAELKAIIAAIHHLPKEAHRVRVVSDSMYALNTLSGKWGRNTNLDLFKSFEKVMSGRTLDIEWEWVKGHNGDKYNEMCDQMCNEILGYDVNAEFEKYKKK